MTPEESIAEFLRQHDMRLGADREELYTLAIDANAAPAVLRASDLRALLAEVRQLTEDRDRARDAAVALEQENARQAEESARLLTAVADAYGLSPAEVLKDVREAIAAERGEAT